MNDTTSDAANIFAPLWKRKWLILAVAILVAAGTYEYYKRQRPTYKATTQLFLGGSAEQAALSSGGGGKATLSGRALADQVGLINSSVIGLGVHKRLRAEGNLGAATGKATATSSASSDFITITTEAHKPRAAAALANAYAAAYIARQRADYRRSVQAQISTVRQQLRRIEAPPGKGGKVSTSTSSTIQSASLASKISQLESTLSSYAGVQQVSPAKAEPLPISPKPKQNAIFGFVLGLILASIAAYALSRFDRRLRSLADVESMFHTEILAALPAVRSPVVRPDGSRAPAKSLLEPLRRLHTTLQLGHVSERARESAPRVLVFLSPDAGDGRSTLVANLARVQCEAGGRVAVVEADFRRPSLAKLLDAPGQYGLADVVTGRISLGEAMQVVKSNQDLSVADGSAPAADGAVSTMVESSTLGSLSLLVGGAAANPPALLGGQAMADLVQSLAEEYDHVLIDAPPPLEVSDVMPLLQLVDGIVLVARIGHTRDVSARRMAQLLDRTATAPVLGAVGNCVPRKDVERYGFAWAPAGPRSRRLIGR